MSSQTEVHRWAVAQMTGSTDRDANAARACELIVKAKSFGCELVALPENANFMGRDRDKPAHAEALDGPFVSAIAEVAKAHGIAVLVGSVVERSDDPQRPHNTSVLLDAQGQVAATYRKIHLFDVEVAGDRVYKESESVTPGRQPVVSRICGVPVGLSVCFDLRFPWLYRALVDQGAKALFVPAAFTVPTGHAHWETLLRARAIETQSYVVAAAQYGTHDTGRQTFGRSLIIDPWGTVLATVPDGGDVAVAELDLGRVDALRQSMPLVPGNR